ncbi:UNVERIFIED_ORG: sodium transport system ATP-binding protein [Peribacillus simplex]
MTRRLIHDPDIILFDEPTTGLDIISSNVFRQLVLQLKQQGNTIIFSSHIMEEVTLLYHSVAMMHKGELIYKRKLESLYIEEKSRDLNYIFMSKLVWRNQSHVS